MKKILITILSVFICLNSLLSQDFKADIKNVNNYYNSVQNFSAIVTTKVLGARDKPMGTYKMILYKNKSSFAYEIQNVMVLLSEKFFITVDKESKTIHCKQVKDRQKLSTLINRQLEEALDKQEGVSYKGTINGDKHYYIELNDDIITGIDLYVDIQKSTYSKIIYYYNKNNEPSGAERAVIEFEKPNMSQEALSILFSEKSYLDFSKSKPIKQAKYKNYTLIFDNTIVK